MTAGRRDRDGQEPATARTAGRRSRDGQEPAVVRQSSRWRRLGVSVLVGVVLMEVGLRLVLGNFGQSRVLVRSDDPEICLEVRAQADLLYTGWRARVPATRIRTNSYGMRGAEFSFDKPAGSLRVAVAGDSFTFGQGVEEDEAFVQVAGARLRQEGIPAEVLNFGVPGHATPQSVALVRERVVPTSPDVVLINVFANDLSPEESWCLYGQGGHPAAAWTLRNVYLARLGVFLASRWVRRSPEPGMQERLGSPADRFQAALRELAELGRTHDFLPAAVLLTNRSQFVQSRHCDGCRPAHDLVDGTGVHVIDLSGTWDRLQDDVEASFIQGDDHFSAAGSAVVGRDLGEAMLDWPELRERLGR